MATRRMGYILPMPHDSGYICGRLLVGVVARTLAPACIAGNEIHVSPKRKKGVLLVMEKNGKGGNLGCCQPCTTSIRILPDKSRLLLIKPC